MDPQAIHMAVEFYRLDNLPDRQIGRSTAGHRTDHCGCHRQPHRDWRYHWHPYDPPWAVAHRQGPMVNTMSRARFLLIMANTLFNPLVPG